MPQNPQYPHLFKTGNNYAMMIEKLFVDLLVNSVN